MSFSGCRGNQIKFSLAVAYRNLFNWRAKFPAPQVRFVDFREVFHTLQFILPSWLSENIEVFRLSACHPALHFWKRTLLNSPLAFRVNRPLGDVEEPSCFAFHVFFLFFFRVVRDSKQDTHFSEHQKQTNNVSKLFSWRSQQHLSYVLSQSGHLLLCKY